MIHVVPPNDIAIVYVDAARGRARPPARRGAAKSMQDSMTSADHLIADAILRFPRLVLRMLLIQEIPPRRDFSLSRLLAKKAGSYYGYTMDRGNPTFLRALLLLLLAIGPLQAQSVFACAMMDTVVHDGCCCEGHETDDYCTNSNCESTLESGDFPCCERAIEVGIDPEAGQNTPPVKSTEVSSGLDPPQALISSFDALFPPHPRLIHGVFHCRPVAGQTGSETYLVTQRLRI